MSQSTPLEDRHPRRSTLSHERPLLTTSVRPVLTYMYVQLAAYVPYRVPHRGHTRHAYVSTSLTRTLPYPSQLTRERP
jgi:hypothetical protein